MIDDVIPVERPAKIYEAMGARWKVLTTSGDLFYIDFATKRLHWWTLEEPLHPVRFGFHVKVKRCEVGKRLRFTCNEMTAPKRLVVEKIWRDEFPTLGLGDPDV